MKRARILLADDHTLTLEGIRGVLEPHHEIVGMVTDGRALVDAALRLEPDLIVLDITMPLLNGIDAAVQIKKRQPGVKLLFVTMHVNPAYLEAALSAGGTGYVLKSAAGEELIEAIKTVLNGRIYITSSLSSNHLERFTDPLRAAATLHLSTREREVLQLIAEGRAAKEIAAGLTISVKTVAFHRENIKRKGSVLIWLLLASSFFLESCIVQRATSQSSVELLFLKGRTCSNEGQVALYSDTERAISNGPMVQFTLANIQIDMIDRPFIREKLAILPEQKCSVAGLYRALHKKLHVCVGQDQWIISLIYDDKINSKFWTIPRIETKTAPFAIIDPLPTHQGGLFFDGIGLSLDNAQRLNRSDYAANADAYQDRSGNGCNGIPLERPSIDIAMILFVCFGFGGLFVGFVPLYVCLLVPLSVHHERILIRIAWCGGCCSSSAILWLFLSGAYPYTWGLPPTWLPKKWNPCKQHDSSRHGLNVSQTLLTLPYFSYYNNYMANVLSTDKQAGIIGALCEGSSIRSIERMTGVHRDTIMRLGVKVGQGCTALMDAKMRNLSCTRLECDEIWGFVGKKDRHVRPDDDPQFGNVWTYCAIDADTKLVPAFRVAKDRDVKTTTAFMLDVADRMKNRVQISTDGLRAYVEAVDSAFGGNVDYGQIIKTYGTEESVEAQRRYSAPKINSIEKKAIYGRPEIDLISTSYVERLNATTRLHMKRLARLTHAFSKKRENFEAAVGLHFAYYNFVRRHNTLRCTPAMAAGVAASFWTVEDLVRAA